MAGCVTIAQRPSLKLPISPLRKVYSLRTRKKIQRTSPPRKSVKRKLFQSSKTKRESHLDWINKQQEELYKRFSERYNLDHDGIPNSPNKLISPAPKPKEKRCR